MAKWPAGPSYRWDERISLMAFALFHAVTLARLLFPLQWLKFLHRKYLGKDRYFQKRTNFHSLFTELYFVGVIVLLIALGHTALAPLKAFAGWYFAVESIVWTAYYLFFRHFIERSFTIYHNAEYFLAFPLALLIQVVGIALALGPQCDDGLTQRSLKSLGYLFNIAYTLPIGQCGDFSDSWVATALPLLGVAYVVILLANLRDAFPKTHVKPATSVCVIGAGDVVANKLLPALVRPLPRVQVGPMSRRTDPVEIHRKAVQVFDVGPASTPPDAIDLTFELPNGRPRVRRVAVKREISSQDVVVEIAAAQTAAIIASPPDSHFFYLSMLAMHGVRFAVEKPITVFDPEVQTLLSPEGERLFSDGFAMSYYALEKALPLTYLHSMHPMHRNHLDIWVARQDYEAVDTLPWNEVVGGLGSPTRVRVLLLEGAARSPSARSAKRRWTEDPHLGGLFYETAIHAVTVLHKVLGDLSGFEPDLQALVSEQAVRQEACSFARLQGEVARGHGRAVKVDLMVGKYMPESLCARGAIIEYPAATICCDFDTMALRVLPTDRALPGSDIVGAVIAVREQYARVRYAVQASLIRAFFEYGWQGQRFDDFATQRAVLAWLSSQRLRFLEAQENMSRYQGNGSGLPADLRQIVDAYLKSRPHRMGDTEA